MRAFLRRWQWPIAMASLAWPGAALRIGVWSAPTPVETLLFGLTIVSAAFLLTWSAEAAERDVPRTLALAGLALVAVLPEYAVDVTFAWKAGKDPSYAAFATANMTGGNRLIIGLGWPLVLGIYLFSWMMFRKQAKAQAAESAVSSSAKPSAAGSR